MVHTAPKTNKMIHKMLGKNLQFCFSKPNNIMSTQLLPPENSKIPSSSFNKHLTNMYDPHSSSSTTSKSFTPSTSNLVSSDSDPNTLTPPTPPDFSAIVASQRFFISSPGHSNSIADAPIAGAIPFRTYSQDPYVDFRRSMVEMVEAKELFDVKADWDSLYELLSCYLQLNPECTHKFIIAAFADVLICLSSPATDRSSRKSDVSDYCSASNRPHMVHK